LEPNLDHLDDGDVYHQALSQLHSELRSLRTRQISMQHELSSLQMESQRIWKENQVMRNRANQQQEIIDRIIRFLASMFSGSEATRNLVMPDFLNTPGVQNVLQMYQSGGGLPDPLYPTAPSSVVAGQKRPLPLTWDDSSFQSNNFPFQETFTHISDSFADQIHDLDDIQDQISKLGDAAGHSEENHHDLDILQYLDEYPIEEEFLPKNHDTHQ
jgi:hypothetical protein